MAAWKAKAKNENGEENYLLKWRRNLSSNVKPQSA
jgi:hypothetical protein